MTGISPASLTQVFVNLSYNDVFAVRMEDERLNDGRRISVTVRRTTRVVG